MNDCNCLIINTLHIAGTPLHDVHDNDTYIKLFSALGVYLVIGMIIFAFVLITIIYIYHNFINQGFHTITLFNILRIFTNITDFFTDILFVIVIYFDDNNNDDHTIFFTIAAVFVIFPYILSCTMGICWISKWRNNHTIYGTRLSLYLDKYETMMYSLMTLSGFYSVIDLCKSKIFYYQMFNLQLKRDEIEVLKHFRLTLSVFQPRKRYGFYVVNFFLSYL